MDSATVRIADNGEVFYLAERDVSSFGFFGLYTNSVDASDFTKVARTDQLFLLADGSTTEITDFIGGANGFDVGPNDTVAFLGNVGQFSDEDSLFLWTNDGTSASVQRSFVEGSPVRGLLDATAIDLDAVSIGPAPRLKLNRQNWAAYQVSDEADSTNPRKTLLVTDGKNGIFRVTLCSPSEPC